MLISTRIWIGSEDFWSPYEKSHIFVTYWVKSSVKSPKLNTSLILSKSSLSETYFYKLK